LKIKESAENLRYGLQGEDPWTEVGETLQLSFWISTLCFFIYLFSISPFSLYNIM